MEGRRNRARRIPVVLTTAEQEAITLSTLVFKGRIILKEVYHDQHLCAPEELEGVIEMPENAFLAIIPHFKEEGLDAAHEYLQFSSAGIGFKNCEGGFAHHSREKLAILYLIIQFEFDRKMPFNALMRDELLSIRKMVDLVDWIANLQSEKDMQAILEKTAIKEFTQPHASPIMKEKLLTSKELAAKLNISIRTFARCKDQFKSYPIGKRNHYLLSECLDFSKK